MKAITKLLPLIFLLFVVSCSRSYREEDLTEKVLSKEDSLRIKEETVAKLDELALASNRSRNELINIFIEYAIENCEVK